MVQQSYSTTLINLYNKSTSNKLSFFLRKFKFKYSEKVSVRILYKLSQKIKTICCNIFPITKNRANNNNNKKI